MNQAHPSTVDQQLADARTATAVAEQKAGHWQGVADAQRAEIEGLRLELSSIEYAAHMPDDYAYGMPSWINQVLWASYIGANPSPHIKAEIAELEALLMGTQILYKALLEALREAEQQRAVLLQEHRALCDVLSADSSTIAGQTLAEALKAIIAERDAAREKHASAVAALRHINDRASAFYGQIGGGANLDAFEATERAVDLYEENERLIDDLAAARALAASEAVRALIHEAVNPSHDHWNDWVHRLRVAADRVGAPPTCPRCGASLDNVSPGVSVVAGGVRVCTPCLRPGEAEIARARGLWSTTTGSKDP